MTEASLRRRDHTTFWLLQEMLLFDLAWEFKVA